MFGITCALLVISESINENQQSSGAKTTCIVAGMVMAFMIDALLIRLLIGA